MLNLGYKSRAKRAVAAGTSDTEALQTDVMRFIAIIGLCLTAVFSLMRSIVEPTTTQYAESRGDKTHEQLAALQQELAHKQQSEQQLRQHLQDQQSQLAQLIKQQKTVTRQHHEQQVRLVQALTNQQQQHNKLKQQSRTKTPREVTQLPPPHEQRQDESVESSNTVEASQPDPMVAVKAVAEKIAAPAAAATQKTPEKRGFVLKFASESSLGNLLKTGQVRLLALTGEQAWQLHPDIHGITFNRVSMPGKYHEMLPGTLPPSYRRSFYAEVNSASDQEPVWAVLLQPATQQQIQRLLQTANSGALTIQPNGSVLLQAGDPQ